MRAWLYYRLSRDEDEEMNSLQNQRQILVDYADQNGYEIVGESFDDNVSGMTFERKGLGEIENAVDSGIIDTILVKDLSRLGRHRTQTAIFIDYLLDNGVNVISVTEGIDSSNENDDLIIGFKQIVNDLYAKDISKKVRAGIRQKQKTGLVVNLPMGYYKDRNTNEILVDEQAADIVREVFRLYIGGYGLTTIAKKLNAQQIKSPEYFLHRKTARTRTELCKRFLWTQTTVKRLLQNEIYTGTLVNHKTVTNKIRKTKTWIPHEERYRHEDFVPVIISKQMWEEAQALIQSRCKSNARASSEKVIHRYSGMIKCSECGASLIAKKRSWDGVPYIEYSCNSYNRYGKEHCSPHRVHEKQIDKLVIEELQKLRETVVNECERYDGIIQDWERNRPIYEQRIGQYEDSIKGLKEQIEQLIMERINDRPHAEIYNSMISKREEQIAEFERKIADCRIYDKVSREKHSELKNTAAIIDEILTAGQLTDAQLRMFVNQVKVHENADKSLDISLELNGDFDNKG